MAFDVEKIVSELARDRERIDEVLVETGKLAAYLAPQGEFPEGAEWRASQYDIRYQYINVHIPELEGRQWRGLNGTSGIVYRLRRYFGVKRLERSLVEESGDTRFSGTFDVDGRTYWLYIHCGQQLPETCRLIEEEVREVRTVKKYRTVCE